jgi:sugar phosphate isomerase/epimerase
VSKSKSPEPGLNLEFARSERLGLAGALRAAAEAGYRCVEPYVYAEVALPINSHLRLQTTSAYHHLNADRLDVAWLRRCRDELGLRFSAFDAHASLLLPQLGVPYLRRAVDLATDLDCPLVMSDEGPLPTDWMTLDQGLDILCISLEAVIRHSQTRGVRFALELHNALTAQPDYLVKLLARFGPAELGVNFDTGNSFLAGNDPVAYVRRVADRVVHVHVKDIPASQLPERGKVTGTRVGVAVGDGVVDVRGVLAVLAAAAYHGVLSVECDTRAQAQASLPVLQTWIDEVSHCSGSAVHQPVPPAQSLPRTRSGRADRPSYRINSAK